MKYPMILFIALFIAAQAFAQEEADEVGGLGGGGIWEYSHGPKNVDPDPDCCGQDLRGEELADFVADQAEREAEEEADRLERAEEARKDSTGDILDKAGDSENQETIMK